MNNEELTSSYVCPYLLPVHTKYVQMFNLVLLCHGNSNRCSKKTSQDRTPYAYRGFATDHKLFAYKVVFKMF
jgi:hypothetical protein